MAAGVTWISRHRSRRLALALGALGSVVALTPTAVPGAGAVAEVPVIVRADDGELTDARALLVGLGGTVEHEVDLINGFIATIPADRVDDLELHDEILDVTPNATVSMAAAPYDAAADTNSVYNASQIVGARQAWNRGFTGKGIGVAVIDTGVTPVPGLDAPGKVIYGPDLTPEGADPATANLDGYGHGTFMAGLIAGNDNLGPVSSQVANSSGYLGIAPDARIVSVKVGDKDGNTVVGSVIMALDWVIKRAKDPDKNIRVVNLSFSTDSSQSYLFDPLAFAVERAWFSGLVVVTAAGNSGDSSGRMTMPGVDPFVVAVGASHPMGTLALTDDDVPTFSSKGDGIRNPDLVAPGVSVQGLKVPGSTADVKFGATANIGDRFIRGSGTSQATAITSGAAALLVGQRSHLRPDQIKKLLTSSATKLGKPRASAQGYGMVNLTKALTLKDPLTTQLWSRASGLGSLIDAGGTWVGNTWSGSTWSGSTWSGSTWSGSTWSGSTWSGSTWSGSTWSGSTWSGSTWSSASWG